MRKLILHIILFLSSVLLGLLLLPVDKRAQFQEMSSECMGQALWIHDRLYKQETEIDVIFLGSSHTINGVNSERIEQQLGNELKLVNFGYCRLGRNLHYVLLKEVLQNKRPKQLILEVREDESRYSHPAFPYLAETAEVFGSYPWFNPDWPKDPVRHLSLKLQLTQEYLFQDQSFHPVHEEPHHFICPDDTAFSTYLQELKMKRQAGKKRLPEIAQQFYDTFPFHYVHAINELCKQHEIELSFLYLPSYGTSWDVPSHEKWYREMGELWIPPSEILSNPDYWYDGAHLNQAGATQLADWLSQLLIYQYK